MPYLNLNRIMYIYHKNKQSHSHTAFKTIKNEYRYNIG